MSDVVPEPDPFLVLGDLTERELGEYTSPARKLIVRMFVGGVTFDQELEVESIDDLRPLVEKRMAALAKKPDKALAAEAPQPLTDPGHALEVPKAEEA